MRKDQVLVANYEELFKHCLQFQVMVLIRVEILTDISLESFKAIKEDLEDYYDEAHFTDEDIKKIWAEAYTGLALDGTIYKDLDPLQDADLAEIRANKVADQIFQLKVRDRMTTDEAINFMFQELDIIVTAVEGGYLLDGDTFVTSEELVDEAEGHSAN